MSNESYADLFCAAFSQGERAPYPYQERLACSSTWPEMLDIPTGMGKTAAVTMAWLYKRGWRRGGRNASIDEATPRRLVWCLPMRVLVEQTQKNIRGWLRNLNILGDPGEGKVSVHLLMGGEPDLKTWAEHPEEDMVLIGTQDMLLSRAMMRGYGMSRYQWPIHFALLHNDCLWAFDEVQLMGAGLTASAQLEAFRRKFLIAKSSRSIWLSATLRRDWLGTVDLADYLPDFNTLGLTDADRAQAAERLDAQKALHCADVSLAAEGNRKDGMKAYIEELSRAILKEHIPDSQTLVILNRVDRAQQLFQQIQRARTEHDDLLIHARFRPIERRRQNDKLSASATDRIIVATQAIEAGVDISSRTLFTELAPWSSLVQRFGRCNRYGEHKADNAAQVFWIDIEDDADTLPYESEALQLARKKLVGLDDVGPGKLPSIDEEPPISAVLRRKDLLDLFNTDPDLSGFDVDVSDYIRDKDAPGLQVFWRDFDLDPNKPEAQPAPERDELCPVSLHQARNFVKSGRRAWYLDNLVQKWQSLSPSSPPRSGMTLLLAATDGGYDEILGFISDGEKEVSVVEHEQDHQHGGYGDDGRSRTKIPVLLADHLGNVAGEARSLCDVVQENANADEVVRAAHWHDVGKAHEVFQQSMHRCPETPDGILAKSNCPGPIKHSRPCFRHELASALAWLAQHDDPNKPDSSIDLVAYLVAAHHGKVRMSLRAMPNETQPVPNDVRFARGVWEGDRLPALSFDGEQTNEVELKLALMELGEGEQGRSWAARTLGLLEEHGPFRLAWLETLVRLADWRASAVEQTPGGMGHG
ncbi:CRISPR-associated helicase Cas3' [Candidatus Poribacteria bacterium]|nr:CRISPR-associated helicase Cas3' [Gammaproteobacteria bacterium]MYF99459.1 CRISPR-associated helicase Cas3' [Candidatus Poribacteria bacterium]